MVRGSGAPAPAARIETASLSKLRIHQNWWIDELRVRHFRCIASIQCICGRILSVGKAEGGEGLVSGLFAARRPQAAPRRRNNAPVGFLRSRRKPSKAEEAAKPRQTGLHRPPASAGPFRGPSAQHRPTFLPVRTSSTANWRVSPHNRGGQR